MIDPVLNDLFAVGLDPLGAVDGRLPNSFSWDFFGPVDDVERERAVVASEINVSADESPRCEA